MQIQEFTVGDADLEANSARTVVMPAGSQITRCEVVGETLVVVALTPDEVLVERHIRAVKSGADIPSAPYDLINTAFVDGTAWHFFSMGETPIEEVPEA